MIIQPATLADLWAVLDGRGISRPKDEWRQVARQIARGPAFAFRAAPNAPPVALMGIVHREISQAWFVPGSDASRHMVALSRAFRRIVAAQASAAGRPIATVVHRENAAGARLAWASGFKHSGASFGPWQTYWRR